MRIQKVTSRILRNKRRCYRDQESMVWQWLQARRTWRYGCVCGTQELGESSQQEDGDVESQVRRWRKKEDRKEIIQDSLRVSVQAFLKGCAPLCNYRNEEIKGLIMGIQVDCWVMRSYKADGHNGVLKVIMCSQCHITLIGNYMVRSGKLRVQ